MAIALRRNFVLDRFWNLDINRAVDSSALGARSRVPYHFALQQGQHADTGIQGEAFLDDGPRRPAQCVKRFAVGGSFSVVLFVPRTEAIGARNIHLESE